MYQCLMNSGKLLIMGPKYVDFLDKNKFGKLVRLLVLLKRNPMPYYKACYFSRNNAVEKVSPQCKFCTVPHF
jgi:hypothetical protein